LGKILIALANLPEDCPSGKDIKEKVLKEVRK